MAGSWSYYAVYRCWREMEEGCDDVHETCMGKLFSGYLLARFPPKARSGQKDVSDQKTIASGPTSGTARRVTEFPTVY